MAEDVLAAFLRGRSPVAHLIDSFDDFCEALPSLFQQTEEISVEKEGSTASIKLLNASLRPPVVKYPWEARLGDQSYSARLFADIHVRLSNEKIDESFRNDEVFVGEIPCMIGSELSNAHADGKIDCPLDPGAYFIVEGAEKVVVPQDSNFGARCSISRKGCWKSYVVYPNKGLSFRNTFTRVLLKEDKGIINLELSITGADPVPIVVALRALGLATDKSVLDVMHATNDPELANMILPSLREAADQVSDFFGDEDVNHRDCAANQEFLASKSRKLKGSFVEALFPALDSPKSKVIYLGYMVEFLCTSYLGRRQPRKNSLVNKRILGVNELLALLLTKAMTRFMRETCKKMLLMKSVTDGIFNDKIVTCDFRDAFKRGVWAQPQTYGSGVVEALKRQNVTCTLAHLRHVRTPSQYSGKVNDSRYPNKSHTGRFCPVETPEGENCGHLKTLALFAMISSHRDETDVLDNLSGYLQDVDEVPLQQLHVFDKVFLNGRLLGLSTRDEAKAAVLHLRNRRRRGAIHSEVEIAPNKHGELQIFTDGGRVLRPVFIVENNEWLLTDDNVSELHGLNNGEEKVRFLLQEGLVELLGPEEEEQCVIASRYSDLRSGIRYTHMELHPAAMLSITASTIPFAQHNLSTRVTYQAQKHSKHAIGYYSCNPSKRFDTTSDSLFYPQKQLVSTSMCRLLSPNDSAMMRGWPEKLMHGQSCVVAVACYDGYNQEDSLIFNQAAIDRGLFRSIHERTHRYNINLQSSEESFGRPVEEDGSPQQRYQHLDEDGFPEIGARLQSSQAVIGKTRKLKEGTVSNSSIFLKNFEEGSVKEVVRLPKIAQGSHDVNVKTASASFPHGGVKVKIASTRAPQAGDKFSSMHGQKGVIGCCLSQEDLPFTRQGIVPDVIINPHAFPTRQTLGQMLESIAGKAAAMGVRVNTTPFSSASPDQLGAALHRCGFQKSGNERFYSGLYGSMIKAEIFVGVCFYQKLMQMADDKIKWRRIGRHDSITRQPIKDRQKYGGIKFSQMERSSLVAHGAAASIQERMFHLSDPHQVEVCTRCDRMASIGRSRAPSCRFCKDKFPGFARLEIPYSCKLLVQELNSMGIDLRLVTDSSASLRGREDKN
ncbi:DNA-directed RNA polymerases IV and V subunit 2 [Selaginella moellendorffii]|uniref:DNA-directed RNA polymerases IV and V subunit 2 n=1 Tax=Selaginella moellendorffii TaxID=88036 RepID=UPI000D1CD8AD|nr:DNA-directed RNA polymerases IV and V subunit 2 [Selaginella moellendorffii]|eukprot:XP_024544534.1 DNA-directed RNA polymerases IV and V subunit 2 [Selaginella moellendorffii]